MVDKMTCDECGTVMVRRGYEHTQSVAGVAVSDRTCMVMRCPGCSNVTLTMQQATGYERRAAATVLWDGKRATGATIKFARKSLGLTQADLAKLLDVTPSTVSKWENGHEPVTRATQLAIVSLLDKGRDGGDVPEIEARLRGQESGVELTVPERISRTG